MDGIITVVDAKHVLEHISVKPKEGVTNEVEQQIAFADRIIMNKTDLVLAEELVEVRSKIHSVNKLVEIIPSQHSKIDLNKILNIRAFDLDKVTEVDPDFLLHLDDEEHDHDHDDCNDPNCHDLKEHKKDHHHKEGHQHKEKKEHKEGHEHKHKEKPKPKHHHASMVTSCGFVLEGEFSMPLFNQWMGQLLREKGKDIYRMKGVLAIEGMPQRFVFQGVHMVFDGSQGAPWKADEKKVNKLVFIGVNLVKEQFNIGLRGCLVSESDS